MSIPKLKKIKSYLENINNLIKDNQKEINNILREYNIPLLDNLGNPLK